MVLIVFCVLLAGRLLLNFTGFCSFSKGWLSDEQIIDAAIANEIIELEKDAKRLAENRLPRHFPPKDWTPGDPSPLIKYETVERFREMNPDCCYLDRFIDAAWNKHVQLWGNYVSDFVVTGLFGFSTNRVFMRYRKYSTGLTPIARTSIGASVCGDVGDRSHRRARFTARFLYR